MTQFRFCATIFSTVRFFRIFFLGHPRPPARIISTAADNYYACGYFITRADIDMTKCYVKRLCDSLKKLIGMFENGKNMI